MEIKIDLHDVLRDEYGSMESFAESIHRQVADNMTNLITKGLEKRINEEVAKKIDEQIKTIVGCQMPSLFSELIDKEYDVRDRYGSYGGKTTMRNQLIKTLTDQMVYKEARYDSDKNYFTKNIDLVASAKMVEFKKIFDAKVDETFTKAAFDYAYNKVVEKFKISS